MSEIKEVSKSVQQFDYLPDSAVVTIDDAMIIASRSRSSLYRDRDLGRIEFVKVCGSTRIRVGELRRFIGAK